MYALPESVEGMLNIVPCKSNTTEQHETQTSDQVDQHITHC